MVSEIVHRLIDGEREDFRNGLQRVLNRVPRRGSTTKPSFFTYSYLGAVLTLPYTKLNDEIGVKASSVKITSDHTVKSVFKIKKDGKTKLVFRTIATVKDIEDAQRLTPDELKEASESLDLTQEELNDCEVEGEIVHIKDRKVNLEKLEVIGKGELNAETLKEVIGDGPLQEFDPKRSQFKKVKGGVIEKGSLNGALKKFSEGSLEAGSDGLSDSAKGTKALFENLSRVYRSEMALKSDSKQAKDKKLGLSDYEAPAHGFVYGTLAMNFRYEHGLRIRPEQAAGKGFVDLVVGSHGHEFRVELKGHGNTVQQAKDQSEKNGYDKAPIMFSFEEEKEEKSVTMVFANLCSDPSSGGLLVEESKVPLKPERFIELFNEHSGESLKEKLKEKLNYLYYSISDSNGGGENTNYLSRLVLGELLAGNSLEKHVIVYDDNELWNSKDYTEPIQMNDVMSTFVLKAQDSKYIILNVIERENFKIDKNIPLPEGVDLSQCIQVEIRVNPGAQGGFEVENDIDKSYYQDIKIGEVTTSGSEYYKGKCEKIGHVKLQDITDILQIEKFEAALFPLRKLITFENHFQAILQGLLSAQKGVNVLPEPNYSSRGRPDLMVSYDGKTGVVEVKLASTERDIERKRKEGETQLEARGDGLEVYTNEEKVTATVLVVCPSAGDKNKFITHFRAEDLNVGHSSRGSSDGEPSPKRRRCLSDRRKRNIGMLCIDSRDEEGIEERDRKEKLVSELFDRDKIREIKENFEFYNQLFEISDQISKGGTIDEDARKALMKKVKDIDLGSIDPEIKEIVKEIKEKTSEEKEEIRNVLTRPGVTEKVRKVAEGAGHALAVCFVAQHVVNGDIEGLGYDALNLLVLPKVGQAVSGKLLELGVKYNSQALKRLAPFLGSVIGNSLAYLGLVGSIKDLRDAKDPIDRKFAELNIATNSIFIAVDIPSVITEIMSSMEISVGVAEEFTGPFGAFAAVTVIIASHFIAAELKVERVEESIKLTDEERTQLYWRFVLGMKAPEYIERDMEAREIYKNYMSEIIDKFKDNFNTIVMTLPYISLTREKRGTGEGRGRCLINTTISDIKYDFGFSASVTYPFHSYTNSRVIPESIESYNVVCGPQDSNIKVQIDDHACADCVVNGIGSGCDNLYSHRNVLLNKTLEKLSLHQYPLSCNNTVVYNDGGSDKHRSVCYMKSQSALIQSENSNITVIFDGDDISVVSTKRKIDVIYSTENKCNFSQPLRKREDHILSGNVFTSEIGEVHESGSNFFSTGNMYYFSQSLKNCKVHKPGDNFFYIEGNNFSCDLGKDGQKNIVVVKGNFTDLNNENIQAIIGSNETNFIEVSHAGYVDGKGGNDTITAKNSTIVVSNFGDNIYGGGVVLLPMALCDISKMILDGDKNTIYSEDGKLTIHGKEMLMKTRDDFFVTATKTDSRTKMVTDLHIVNYNGTEVLEAHDDCVSGNDRIQESILYAFEELAFREGSKNVGFHFMHKLFNGTHLHKDTSGSVFVDSIPFIIMSALKGKFPSNPNFKTTRQMFSKKLDVVIGDYGHHVFYADRQSHFFYWEGAKNVPNFYLFDDKNVTVIINKGNGLLDFSMVKSEEKYKVEVEEDAVFIVKGNVRAVLPMNYKNITVTFDQKEYYKLQGGKLERDYCSHSLKIDERFRVNSTDLLNYNCLTFDTDKVFFLRLGNDLQLVSNKGALSILDYYKPDSDAPCTNDLLYIIGMKECADSLDLSIKLSNRIIKPEEFRKRANNPSVFRYYQLGEEGLEIYHNQPTNNHQIGLMDLKDKSILDCSVRITSGNLILSFKNTAIVQVKNWNIYQPAREMMFIFNDTVISNAKCVVSNCDPKDVMVEFNKEKIILQIFYAIKQDNIDDKDKDGKTLFHIVAKEGDLGSAMLLVDKIESINFERSLYAEPDELVRAVLQRERLKSLINTKDKFGYTPLQYAAKEDKWDIVNLFLDKTAERNPDDVTSKNQFSVSWTTVHYAVYNGNLNLIKDIFQFLSDKGTIVNTKDSSGWAPLHYAVLYDASDMVKFLVDEGASVEIEDIDGKTPLKLARESGKPEIVSYLEGKLNEEKGKPAQRKRRHHHGDRSRYHNRGQKQLQEEERPNLESIDVSDRHSIRKEDKKEGTHRIRHKRHEQHHRGHLQERKQGGATSGASKQSSWINVFANTIVGAVKGASQFISSPFKPAIDMEHSQPSKAATTQGTDVNGTLFLLDVFIRKITGQKYVSTADQPTISLPEAVFYASDIINGFEKAVEQAASKSGMSMHRLVDIDSMEMRKEITGKIMGGKFNEIPGVLISYAEKACPGKEAGCPGKLSPKKFDKFMTTFNNRINITLDESILQILHSEHNKSKVKNIEEQQRNLKDKKQPRSYLDDSSVQGLLTQAVVSNSLRERIFII